VKQKGGNVKKNESKKRKRRAQKKKPEIALFPLFAARHWKVGSIAQSRWKGENQGTRERKRE
jgi:hypothetical protein